MTRFTKLDLSQLAPPALIETVDYEAILADQKAWVQSTWDAYRVGRPDLPTLDTLMLETEPIVIILEAVAYRETLLRALVNDKARALLLAYSVGTDLDQLGALFDTPRRLIDPVNKIYQSDAEYREEIQLAPEAFSVAGPEGSYVYFARRSHPSLSDAIAINPHSNRVDVVVLARDGNGVATSEAVTAAYNALSPKTTRPLTDDVHTMSSRPIDAAVRVLIQIGGGPAPETVRANATKALDNYRLLRRRIGMALRTDGLIGAARSGAAGIEKVIVESPAADVIPDGYSHVNVTSITVDVEVIDD
jgi:phage-related baseplate assembly protein